MTAHLEEKVNLSFESGNGKLYRKLLLQYVRHLVHVNDEKRLREICDSLLGPVHQTSSDWSDTLLGTLSKGKIVDKLVDTRKSVQFDRNFLKGSENSVKILSYNIKWLSLDSKISA